MWVIIYGTTIGAIKGLSRSLEYSSYRDNMGGCQNYGPFFGSLL